MKYIGFYLVIVCTFVSMDITAQVLPPDNPNWEQVFVDEFDTLVVDTTSGMWNKPNWDWVYNDSIYMICDPWNPGQYMYYISKRTTQANFLFDTLGTGSLTMRAKRENPPILMLSKDDCNNIDSIPVYYYFTQPISMSTQFDYKYGYFEIRSKIPYIDTSLYTCRGIQSNFWLFGSNWYTTPPVWSEIDVYEYYHGKYGTPPNDTNVIRTPFFGPNIHFQDCYHTPYCSDTIHYVDNPKPPTYCNDGQFHIYSVKWSPEKIEFFFDGSLIYTSINHCDSMKEQHIIVDMGFDFLYQPTADTYFPFDYVIDYVKAYQLKQHCNDDIVITSFNSSTFDFSLYKTVTFGDGTNPLTVSSASPVVILSTDGFTIDKNVTINNGTELLLDFDYCQPDAINRGLTGFDIEALKLHDAYKPH